jgi:hypothetical protein
MVHDRLRRGQAADWARKAGLSHAALYNVIAGKRRPSEELAQRLSACAPIPVAWEELRNQTLLEDLI